jgi:hypothetical protein
MQSLQAVRKPLDTELHPPLDVKIFVHRETGEAEKALSLWLQQNQVHIHHVGQSQSEKNGSFVFTITLFYSWK